VRFKWPLEEGNVALVRVVDSVDSLFMVKKKETVISVKGHGELGDSVMERLRRIRGAFEGTATLKDKKEALTKLKSVIVN